MKGHDESCQEFLAERHDHATPDHGAMSHVTGQAVSECLANVNWDGDLCEHRGVFYTNFYLLTNSFAGAGVEYNRSDREFRMMKRRSRILLLALAYLSFVSLGLPDGLNGV